MKDKAKKSFLTASLFFLFSPMIISQQASALDIQAPTFIDDVKVNLQIRPRYEYVDDHTLRKNANALTTRVAIGAKINKIFQVPNLTAYIEATYVGALIDDYYPQKGTNANLSTNYATVADPDLTRITEAYLKYTLNKTSIIIGRTRINLDDERFIGSVDWRQMPQTFGIIGVQDNTINNLNIFIAGIYARKGVSDNQVSFDTMDWKLDKMPLIFNISYKIIPQLKLTGYAYLLSAKSQDGQTFKGGNTYGINATGDIVISKDIKLSYLGEYAIQKDPYAKDNLTTKPKISADYYRGEIKLSGYGFFIIGGYERFQGADYGESAGFTTPFATLHKWEGWADKFLSYVATDMRYGLRDAYGTVGYSHKEYGTFSITYHKFDADKSTGYQGTALTTISSKNFGDEIDLLYSVNLTKRLNFLVKGAFYNGKDTMPSNLGKNDLTKYWVQLTYKY
ncbi:hypothetical protein [Sulfurihydrogenibium sp.]|uniref:hypothetical protein n=1 Tax=Sulfurihydrogenibium sp. TaxID=2053621 RepID=UPI002628B6B1|nr:hypothetical protein [Sulfurihydrogenibium sp.]